MTSVSKVSHSMAVLPLNPFLAIKYKEEEKFVYEE
jgi:hypothetical protein